MLSIIIPKKINVDYSKVVYLFFRINLNTIIHSTHAKAGRSRLGFSHKRAYVTF